MSKKIPVYFSRYNLPSDAVPVYGPDTKQACRNYIQDEMFGNYGILFHKEKKLWYVIEF